MGTRSTIKFIEKTAEGKEIQLINIYQQYDGYIEGVGYQLANFLINKKLVNGIPMYNKNVNIANGLGCLIAQFIKEFKTDVGGLYIEAPDLNEEYNYYVYFDSQHYFDGLVNVFYIKVKDYNNNLIFAGTPKSLLKFKENCDD